jgi:hypothetical protein
MSTKRI